MTWDGVPWAIGAGARNSAETGRLQTYICSGGATGVLSATDLAVMALDVPDSQVRVLQGAAVIRNRGANQFAQSYAARNPSEDVVDITPTGSGGGRSDLIIANIENNTISGEPWPEPPSVTDGPYIYTRVVAGVPSSTTSIRQIHPEYSAITLARIDIPVSTSAITQAMIKDMRSVYNVATGGIQGPAGGGGDNTGNFDSPPTNLPGEGTVLATDTDALRFPFSTGWPVTIPATANRVDISLNFTGVKMTGSRWSGHAHVNFTGIGSSGDFALEFTNPNGSGASRVSYTISVPNMVVPVSVRGTTQQVYAMASAAVVDPGSGSVSGDSATQCICSARFRQVPETP